MFNAICALFSSDNSLMLRQICYIMPGKYAATSNGSYGVDHLLYPSLATIYLVPRFMGIVVLSPEVRGKYRLLLAIDRDSNADPHSAK
jgi:hypothetical protein